MNAQIELRCRSCQEVCAIITDELTPEVEAIARSLPVQCFTCTRLNMMRAERTEQRAPRLPYRDE